MHPVLKYRGGKLRELPRLLDHVPQGFYRYIEPFLGGGALYFALEPSRAILNDINSRLMTFYTQLRDHYPQMCDQLKQLQSLYQLNQARYTALKAAYPDCRVPNANEAFYYRMRDQFNQPDGTLLEGVIYYFINKTAYGGMIRYNARGMFNVPYGWYSCLNTSLITKQHQVLLQGATLLNTDYHDIVVKAGADDFIFLDPPYDCVYHDYGNRTPEGGFDAAQHRRLAADFRRLPCRALLVIGKTPLTEALYAPYIVAAYEKRYAVNIRNRFSHTQTHLIVRNY